MAKSEQRHVWGSPFFRDMVADRVRFALTRYFSRKAQVADISSFVILVPLGDGKRIFLKIGF